MSSVSSSSKHVLVTTTAAQRPRAIAIVLGHLGADLAELKRLSKLYADRNCSVVAALSPQLSFFLAEHRRFAPVTTAVRVDTESLLHGVPANTPVVVHSWSKWRGLSVGGAPQGSRPGRDRRAPGEGRRLRFLSMLPAHALETGTLLGGCLSVSRLEPPRPEGVAVGEFPRAESVVSADGQPPAILQLLDLHAQTTVLRSGIPLFDQR